MPGVISNNYADGITLSANPTTLTGTITNTLAAVYAPAGTLWSVVNTGLISSSAYYGIALIGPGAVSNAAGASITGYSGGIVGFRDITLTNAGVIGATSNFGTGVLSNQYGDINNLAGAVITGDEAINLSYGGTVENAGTIAATEFAIITGGGLINNAAGGVIRGEIPILFEGSGTVINAGTIAAVPDGIAISFDGPNDVLVLEPGGVLTGPVDGFRAGDKLDFAGLTASSASFAGGILTLYDGSAVASIALGGQLISNEFTLSSDGNGGTDVTLGVATVTGTYGYFGLSAPVTSFTSSVHISNKSAAVFTGSAGTYTVRNAGTITASAAMYGEGVALQDGTLTNLAGGVILGGASGVEINAGYVDNFGTIGATTSAGSAIALVASDGDVGIRLERGSRLLGGISGFEAGDSIDLAGITASSAVFNANTLTLLNAGSIAATLSLIGNFNTPEFIVAPDGSGGTSISLGPTETLSGSYAGGVKLSALYTSIAAGTTINPGRYESLYAPEGRNWTLNNDGVLGSPADGETALFVTSDVTNQSRGVINGGVFIAGGSLLNQGTIYGSQFFGILTEPFGRASAVANVVTAVEVAPTGYGNAGLPLTITNAANGLIAGLGGVDLQAPGETLVNAGTIASTSGASGVAVEFSDGNDRLIIDPSAVFTGAINALSTLNSFEAHQQQAPLENVLEFAAGAAAGTLGGIGETVTGFNTISFDLGAAWSVSGNAAGLAAGETFIGFGGQDTLHLDGFTMRSESFVTGVGLVLQGAGGPETLDLTGNIAPFGFDVFNDATGTVIEAALCFLRGTRIATPAGERRVEELRAGDTVITRFSGVQRIRWIGRQSYAPRFLSTDRLPVRISAGALGEGLPARDLMVSPGHSMLLGGTLVLAKSLVNGINITQDDMPEQVDYFAIELDEHDCVIAEGCFAETYADGPGLRNQFHNVAEFYAAFPHYAEPAALCLCAPRPEGGPELAAALAPIVARAAARTSPGALRGFIDMVGQTRVEGWAQDIANPELPVALEICQGGDVLGSALACDYRADLAEAGIGKGRAMFSFTLPDGLDGTSRDSITVRRSGGGPKLPRSQYCLEHPIAA